MSEHDPALIDKTIRVLVRLPWRSVTADRAARAVLDAVADDLRDHCHVELQARADTHREVAESMTAKWQEELQRADSLERMNDALADRRANHEPWHCCCAEGSHVGQAAALNRMKARAEQAETERDEWKRRRDNAVETCRFRHQEGMTAREWHLKICAAAQATERAEAALSLLLADVEALADDGGHEGFIPAHCLDALVEKHQDRA